MPYSTNLASNTSLNTKLNEVKGETTNKINLATTSALTAVENKIPSVSTLVKKNDNKTNNNEIKKEITEHNHDKYITTPEFNKIMADIFAVRLKRANLGSKSGIANLVNKTDFDEKLKNLNKKVTTNKTKNVRVENELKKLHKFDSSLFIGQSYFNNDATQL